jgi:UDP-2,3-diacylglucosamine hydrolase
MTTLFISDLHLSGEHPEKLALFKQLLTKAAHSADALYILGDLFEVWLGDDDTTPPHPEILSALAHFSGQGKALYVMHGNRDFMMRSQFESLTGCRLLPDIFVTEICGQRALLMHGDLLCTQDVKYQALRRKVRNPLRQWLFLMMPLTMRVKVAKRLRENSKQETQLKEQSIMDVTLSEVERLMAGNGVSLLIHGHTHRPAIHDFTVNGNPAKRIVLGDWYGEENLILVFNEQGPALIRAEDFVAIPAH